MIEQGLGQSVRGEKDYSVVIITGAEHVKELRSKHFRKHLSEQTKTQIELGLEIAEMGRSEIEKGNKPLDALIGLIDQCLKRNPSWTSFYIERMDGLKPSVKEGAALTIFQAELDGEQQLQRGEVDRAVKTLQKFIDSEVKEVGDRAWCIQEMARYTASRSAVEANKLQVAAYKQNGFLLKPRDGIQVTRLEISQKRTTGVITWLRQFDSPEELMLATDEIVGRLRFGVDADAFEAAFNDLGKALGFSTERPDKKWKAGPGNLWCLRDGEYFLVECNSEVKFDRNALYKEESGQMNNACAWFNDNYPGAKAHRVMVIPTQKCGDRAGFVEIVQIMRKAELKKMTKKFKAFMSEFRGVDPQNLTEQRV